MNEKRTYALHRAASLVRHNPKTAYTLLLAAMGKRLDSATRREANDLLRKAGLDGNGRFRSVGQALNYAFDALSKVGIEQDTTLSAHLFNAPSGTRGLDIAFSNKEDPFSPESITNSMLHFSWTELEKDRYEVVAYLS
jgi:hypothetical protein